MESWTSHSSAAAAAAAASAVAMPQGPRPAAECPACTIVRVYRHSQYSTYMGAAATPSPPAVDHSYEGRGHSTSIQISFLTSSSNLHDG